MDYIKIRFVDNPENVESEFRKAIEEMLLPANPHFTLSRHRWRPQVDIYETGREIIILAEVAGVRREDILLEISPGTVKVSGIRKMEMPPDQARYRLAEIPCGYFERALSLPTLIDTETASAICRNGLLEVRMTKRPLNRAHRISIQSG